MSYFTASDWDNNGNLAAGIERGYQKSYAAFQSTRSLSDLVALLGLGVVGVFMKRFGWPRPALLIGYVLAPQAETYLYQAVQFNGWSFLIQPGVLIIAAIIAVSVFFGLRNRVDESPDRDWR